MVVASISEEIPGTDDLQGPQEGHKSASERALNGRRPDGGRTVGGPWPDGGGAASSRSVSEQRSSCQQPPPTAHRPAPSAHRPPPTAQRLAASNRRLASDVGGEGGRPSVGWPMISTLQGGSGQPSGSLRVPNRLGRMGGGSSAPGWVRVPSIGAWVRGAHPGAGPSFLVRSILPRTHVGLVVEFQSAASADQSNLDQIDA